MLLFSVGLVFLIQPGLWESVSALGWGRRLALRRIIEQHVVYIIQESLFESKGVSELKRVRDPKDAPLELVSQVLHILLLCQRCQSGLLNTSQMYRDYWGLSAYFGLKGPL